MGELVCSMTGSLDGYAEAAIGHLGFGAEDEEMHTFIDATFRSVSTYLYCRRMYETMVFWKTAHALPDVPPYVVEYSRGWQSAEKVAYSMSLKSASERTCIERSFDMNVVRRLEAEAGHDLSVSGPTLAARAVAATEVIECVFESVSGLP